MAEQHLKQLLGKSFSIAACVGAIIGLGIMRTPGEIAAVIDDPVLYITLWLGGGVFVLASIMFVAELIAITPKSGGPYTLVAHAYGPYPGFLIGWTDWLSSCSATALKAIVVIEYLALLVPGFAHWLIPGALIVSSLFAALQLGGVRLGGGIYQIAATVFGLILISVACAIFYGGLMQEQVITTPVTVIKPGIEQFGLVAAAIVFTYDGWITASYFSAEIKGGGRAVAIGSIKGVIIVLFLYVLLNSILAFSLPLHSLAGHDLALAGAIELLYGQQAGLFIVCAAIFILLAHQNAAYMWNTRTFYALSVDGLGNQHATQVSNSGTPTGALFFTWIAMITLILTGGFELLLNMAALLFILLYVALVIGVFRLRSIEADRERPYRAFAYPWLGVFLALAWFLIAVFIAVSNPQSAVYASVIIIISVPAYLWLRYRSRYTADSDNE